MRLFAAVIPPTACLDHLATALGMLGADLRPAWLPRDNWHLTTAFYGEVPDGLAAALAQDWPQRGRDLVPFEAALAGAGMFAHRTAWIGAQVDDAAWRRLTRALAPSVLGLDDREHQERNRPHLTIARAGAAPRNAPRGRPSPTGADGVAAAVAALAVYRGPSWTVTEVGLFASALGRGEGGHPRYTRLATAHFGNDSSDSQPVARDARAARG
ncbi:MAG: RNA 2',3'-cyclic phosphodiesterase [Propionibacteriaceae bacterium]|nr:RNA 2',3'-cyclic phosphodiesterase [Propionibacteriaceae bacterium]